MSEKTRNTFRLISVLLVIIVIAMYFGLLPFIDIIDEFWVMVGAYGLLLYTLR